MITFHISKKSINDVNDLFLEDIHNTDGYNAFYTIYSINKIYKDRIDINLTSKTFEAYNNIYNDNNIIYDKNLIIDVLITILSDTIQHEYLHKAMGIKTNLDVSRYDSDKIIERLIKG